MACVFDTLMFLSAWAAEESIGIGNALSAYYNDAKESIIKKTIFPRYLSPFFCGRGETESFLYDIFFDRIYSMCNFETLQHTVNNKSYIKRVFWEYHLPNVDDQAMHSIITMENPDKVVEALSQRSTSRETDTYLFYIFANFDKVAGDLYNLIHSVYIQMKELREVILSAICAEALKKENVYIKLNAITEANVKNESDFTVSVSLMKSDLFSYRINERNFVLLGYDFEKLLDSSYRYADVSLYSFAQAVAGNSSKYDIFTVLSNQSPLTTAELSIHLNMSRSALDYNLSEMVKSRLITVEPIDGRTNSYSINTEYLQVVSRLLNIFLYKSQ